MKTFKLAPALISILLFFLNVGYGQVNEEDEVEESIPAISCQTSDGEAGICTLLLSCPPILANVDLVSNNSCNLSGNDNDGVCCPDAIQQDELLSAPASGVAARPQSSAPASGFGGSGFSGSGFGGSGFGGSGFGGSGFGGSGFSGPIPALNVDEKVLEKSINRAIEIIEEVSKLENKSLADQEAVNTNDEAEDLHDFINFAFPEAVEADKKGILSLETSKQLAAEFNATAATFPLAHSASPASGFSGVGFSTGVAGPSCSPETIECPASKYRTINGACNNEQNNDWGKSFTALSRMAFFARYNDGFGEPPVAKSGKPLPSCRKITTTVIKPSSKLHRRLNSLFTAIGQFIDHDLSQTPSNRFSGRGFCCTKEGKAHHHCLAIEIPEDDPFYKAFDVTCQHFARSLTVNNTCQSAQREQMNQLTSFLDASQIYGNLDEKSKELRSHNDGKLKTEQLDTEFPPHSTACGQQPSKEMICFLTGDTRSTEGPVLGLFHVLFLREHNRIATQLAKLHPEWDDETLFQESRRIVIAIYQNIIYKEFLPILLGFQGLRKHDILLGRDGFVDKYDSFINPSIINEFAAAAFRYGHSMVQERVQLLSPEGKVQHQLLVNLFVKPLNTSLFENYLRGALSQNSEEMDANVVTALTNRLFQSSSKFGLDLAAINCQRGRDHGLPSYTQMRDHCFLEPVFSFKDLEKHMQTDVARSMSKVYESVEDIDLWAGGIAERPVPGAVIGPVFSCIVGEQFKRLRQGDRFWFERGNTESSFTEAQLKQIRKSSLARLICDNTDLQEIQPFAFYSAFRWNSKVFCSNSRLIPKVFLSRWNGSSK